MRSRRTDRADRPPSEPEAVPADGDWYSVLAGTAEDMARTVENTATILDKIAENRDHHHTEARDCAARSRRLAAALRDAAKAFRARDIPAESVQALIRSP